MFEDVESGEDLGGDAAFGVYGAAAGDADVLFIIATGVVDAGERVWDEWRDCVEV